MLNQILDLGAQEYYFLKEKKKKRPKTYFELTFMLALILVLR